MEVIPQSNVIGAEILGIDLSGDISPELIVQINQAFLEHQVIFFRDQALTPQRYMEFAARFGEPMDYMFANGMDGFPFITEIIKGESETEGFGDFWHSDSTYLEYPPKATMLYAKQTPHLGGDTLFASMYAAYDGLSPGMQSLLVSLKAVNSASVVPRDEDIYKEVKSKNSDRKDQQAVHPVIRTHGETGRKALYVNGIHTLKLEGMTIEESAPLLGYLYEQAHHPEYAFRLQWRAGTLAIWDNRCTQHYALNDYHGHRRVMHRIIVEGERPV